MKFENNYNVDAPIDQVWKAILDVERVAPCVPGAQVIERTGEDAYKVAIRVKVGPMSMQYRGDIQVTESDPEAHRAVMHTRARETRGQGTADANMEMRLDGDESRTHGTIDTDVKLSGRVAAMGGGVIKDVSARIVDTFAQNLATMLAGDTEAPAADPADKQPSVAPSPNGEPVPAQAAAAKAPPSTGAREPTAARPAPSPAPGAPSAGRSAPAADEDASLPALSILGSVIAGRLRSPRVLGATLGVVAVVVFLLRRRSR